LQRGILPISQSSFSEGSFLADFPITGSGESYANCGSFFTVGCLNVEEHYGISNLVEGIDLSGAGKAYLERRKNSCHRPICPTCWEDWANREKDRAVERLKAFVLKGRKLKPIHVTVSISHVDYELPLQKMREKVYKALKAVRMIGGMMIFHPKRQRFDRSWYYSPHFHIIGYGWIQDVRRNYFATGCIVKNVGIRKTVEGTIFYQLSHCGISPKHHTITWFGALSYNKLHVEYEEKEPSLCPMCGNKLKKLLWYGEGDPPELPDVEGIGFYDDADNWIYRPKVSFNYDD
jgi:hypothetical protein